jgi:PHP family Zn ribbon phosphoesterase
MTGLRFVACDRCETVFAQPSPSASTDRCDVCDGGHLKEITGRLGGDDYFTSALREDP